MRRSPFLLICAATALAIIATLAWIKWNEPATNRHLEAEIARMIVKNMAIPSGKLAPGDMKITITDREGGPQVYLTIRGKATISRRAFSLLHPRTGKLTAFDPSGEVTTDFIATASLRPQHVSAAPWLGARRPTWRVVALRQPANAAYDRGAVPLIEAWNHPGGIPANAVFDAHLCFRNDFRNAPVRDSAIFLIACRALIAENRPQEAASLAPEIHRRDELESLLGINFRQTMTDIIVAAPEENPGAASP